MGRRKSLLVYDSFEAHVTDTVTASFFSRSMSLNKPFRDGVRKQWMADGIHEFTGRQKASEELICS